MKQEEFVELVKAAKMETSDKYAPQFVISLSVATAYGTHTECKTLVYIPSEFAMLSSVAARAQIETVRRQLAKAAAEKLRVRA